MAKTTTSSNSDRQLAIKIIVFSLVLLLFASWAWYRFVFTDAERTFWATVDANLKTYGVTRQINQTDETNNVQRYIQLQYGDPTLARDVSEIQQLTDDSTTEVTSEVLGTPDANYIRYRKLATDQGGTPKDFSAVENIWAKQDVEPLEQSVADSTFRDAVIGPIYAVPFVNLPAAQRSQLLQFMQNSNVYDVDFASAKLVNKNGKTAYEYNVKTNVSAYIEMVKRLDAIIGLNQLQNLDSSQYADQPPVELIMVVDVNARQIIEISYPQIEQSETLTGYGARILDELPEAKVSREELESKLQQILQ